ncbi:efflux RND transporter periplasmic adaptor subunit [Aegicerativicinus sediminis]|uniref:efflux RND transporter periplasmic adaptor subunit n=1 Tax=Aegicerativicinus sediminis TaxID=2893202 RepID=UPI001E28424D|nr:efflux RND transporter periplasmic adaptor subunit [Aegicerativicinus sediminis]
MRKLSFKTPYLFKICLLLFVTNIYLSSCKNASEENLESEISTNNDLNTSYEITTEQFEASEMKLAKLEMHEFHEGVKTTGMFDVPPQNKVSVSVYFGGYVKDILLLPGDKIRKGQKLFSLENPDYVEVQREFLEARDQLSYLKSDYERQKNLSEENVTSQKKFLKSEADYKVTLAHFESLKKKLNLMNINPNNLTASNISTTINLYAPMDGFVTEIFISKGSYVQPSIPAMSIVNLDHMHLELNIFEKDVAKVKEEQLIEFNVQNDPNKTYRAKVHLVNKAIDPTNRTVKVHGHLEDEKHLEKFAPGMYIEASIFTDSEEKWSIPQEAVVELEGDYFVLVREQVNDMYIFEKRKVQVGKTSGEFVEIINSSDFRGKEFLVKGAYDILVE